MIKINFFCYVIFSCFSLSLFSQELDWLKSATSTTSFANHSFYASAQHDDDFYFAGDFWPNLTIDGSSVDIEGDYADGFIIKMDESGLSNSIWHLKSNNYVRINALEVNPVTGNLIATGYYRDDLIYNDVIWNSTYSQTGIVMSFTGDGTLEWIRELEPQSNTSSAGGKGLAIDDLGNIFVAMQAVGGVNIDSETFTFEPETGGAVIMKFNMNGDLLAADIWENPTFESSIDITTMDIDPNNQLIIAGCVAGSIVIDDVSYDFSGVSLQPFIIKLNDELNVQWLKTYQSFRCHVIDVLIDEDDIILSLQYNSSVDVDGTVLIGSDSWGDMAIISMNGNAELNWVKNFILSENAGIYGVYGNSIVHWMDQYFIGGMYQGDVLHEDSLILDNNASGPSYQYPFILSLNQEGELTNVYDFIGSSGPSRITTLSVAESQLLFGGDFAGQVSLDGSTVSASNTVLFYGALVPDPTGVHEIGNNASQFSIYPTLAADLINIATESKVSQFYLTSSTGKLIKEYSGDIVTIDVHDLATGLYYLSAEIDDEMYVVKFIKE